MLSSFRMQNVQSANMMMLLLDMQKKPWVMLQIKQW